MSEPNRSVAERVNGAATLPRGRHGIPPEQVIANQRQRMLTATASLFAEQGYASFSVGDVITRAQVSRATFYKLFDDKAECVLITHRVAFEHLDAAMVSACLAGGSWPESVAAAITAALGFAAAEPAQACILAFTPLAGDPRLTKQAQAANKHLLNLLRAGRERCPGAAEVGPLTEQALLLGAVHVIGAELLEGRAERLSELGPEITEILLTPYVGGAEAKHVAAAT